MIFCDQLIGSEIIYLKKCFGNKQWQAYGKIIFPYQYLDKVTCPVNKYEDVTRKLVLPRFVDHKSAYSVKTLAHIGRHTI